MTRSWLGWIERLSIAGPVPWRRARSPRVATLLGGLLLLLGGHAVGAGPGSGTGTAVAQAAATATAAPAEPILRIEAGMHTGWITGIGIDDEGRWAVTSGDDKTARVWEVATGRLLRVLRVPIGPGNDGKLYTAAMSPDGAAVALGGWVRTGGENAYSIYLFDRDSGRVLKRYLGLPSVVNQLAFSPDGQWLAANLGNGAGVRVMRWRESAPVLADRDHGVSGTGLGWADDDVLVAGSVDGKVRFYEVAEGRLEKLHEATVPGGGRLATLAVHPDGDRLAVGYSDRTLVQVLDLQTFRVLATPSLAGLEQNTLSQVAWSHDGLTLAAAGASRRGGKVVVRRWPEAGAGAPLDTPVSTSSVTELVAGPDGAWFVASTEPAWGLVRPDGSFALRGGSPIADFAAPRGEPFLLSPGGSTVQFGTGAGDGAPPLRFDLATRVLADGPLAGAAPARTDGLPVDQWQGRSGVRLAGRVLEVQPNEVTRSLAVTPDASAFVLGSDWWLRMFDASGKPLWRRPVPGPALRVHVPPSGRVVVVGYDDGTIRWHRLSDGEELLALFVHRDRKRWVLWTPAGYYDASPGGEDLIGWVVNMPPPRAADFFPAARFRDRYRRPDVIDQLLPTLDAAKALEAADAARGAGAPAAAPKALAQSLPPVIELTTPAEVSATQPKLVIGWRASSGADAPVTGLRVRVNGQPQATTRALEVVPASDGARQVEVTLPAEDAQVQLFAENRHGVSPPATVRVKWSGAITASADLLKPKLYVLAIGVSAYQHAAIPKLAYAAKDARDFVATLQARREPLYREVEVKLLTDQQATKDDVLDALDWLQKQVTSRDVGMLFLSGHGVNDASLGYVYLPVNADPDKLKRTAVTMTDIRTTLTSLAGKAVAFLDTCHSGNVLGSTQRAFNDLTGVVSELASAENGVVVFSSSTGRQYSLEDPQWSNGAFTKALIEGLGGAADLMKSGRVTHTLLDVYVTERVKVLTGGRQSPVKQAPGGVNDFPLIAVK